MTRRITHQNGSIIFQMLIFCAVAFIFVGGFMAWVSSNLRFAKSVYHRELAVNIAEAGIEYYRWHLAHDPNDFEDDTGQPGPYVHPYYDAGGTLVGEFSLDITPPEDGQHTVLIRSTGTTDQPPTLSRTLEVVLGQPSLAEYAVIGNSDLYFAENVTIIGKIHANGGIRFDGIANNLITSARTSYDDTSHSGANEFGVHTHVAPTDPTPPAAVPTRTDVFKGGRQFPTPTFDFAGLTSDLATIKSNAQSSGLYLPNSGALGYHLIFNPNDTIDVYLVTGLEAPPLPTCTNSQNQTGWGTWSIAAQTFSQTVPVPTNGALFVEDDAWVDGTVSSAFVTIGAARFPENPTTYANIIINKSLRYTNYDGSDALGLIAQNNVIIGMVSDDTMRIDAALVAKNGKIFRYYYQSPDCNPYHQRNSLTLFGLVASNGPYGTRYTDGNGYQQRIITYDANLIYHSPPFFPATASQYDVLSWHEAR